MNFKNRLFADKMEYLISRKKQKGCILCNIINHNGKAVDLTLYKNKEIVVSLNLYPYNPGHLIVFPVRHITSLKGITAKFSIVLMETIKKSTEILDRLYNPAGYNIGINIGRVAGASINHLHWHIVPRYKNETGLLEVISGTKVIIETVEKSYKRLYKEFKK